MNRDLHYGISEQAKASRHRLDDAHVLLNAARWRCAMYIAGYAVECLLKTKLMQMYNCKLEALLKLAQGYNRLRQNQSLWRMFNTVNRWVPAWRYTANLANREDATDFMDAVEKVMHWIDNNI